MKRKMIAWIGIIALLAGMLSGCSSIVEKVLSEREKPADSFRGETEEIDMGDHTYYTVYVKADLDWGIPYVWAWSETKGDLYEEWPGQMMNYGTDGWYYLGVPINYDNVVISGRTGTIQTEDEMTFGSDIWFTISNDEYTTEYSKPVETTAPSEGYIEVLEGVWQEANFEDGGSSIQSHAKVYSQTVYNCTEMTIDMDLEMNYGTNCKDWNLWGRSGGTFVKLAKIHHPDGNGAAQIYVKFDNPVTFDAIAITPTIPGGYSWSMGFVLRDIYTAN